MVGAFFMQPYRWFAGFVDVVVIVVVVVVVLVGSVPQAHAVSQLIVALYQEIQTGKSRASR